MTSVSTIIIMLIVIWWWSRLERMAVVIKILKHSIRKKTNVKSIFGIRCFQNDQKSGKKL